MHTSCYIIVKGKNTAFNRVDCAGVRLTKNKPSVDSNEIAVKCTLEIPDALFKKPQLEVNIAVPDSHPIDTVITPDITDNIAEIIRSQTGFNVTIATTTGDKVE